MLLKLAIILLYICFKRHSSLPFIEKLWHLINETIQIILTDAQKKKSKKKGRLFASPK